MFGKNIIVFLYFIGLSSSIPVDEKITVEIINTKLVSDLGIKGEVAVVKGPKQDEDGGAEEAVGGLVGVGNNLEQIASGISSGNLGSIFSGSASFIGDSGTRDTVTGLLDNLSKTLNQIISDSISRLAGGLAPTTQRSVTTATAAAATE